MVITKHSKQRIVERTDGVNTFAEAKRLAKQARISGKTLNNFQKYPKFFSYLQNKKNQTNDCSIRIYRGCIYIWRGKTKTLVTAHPIPDRYIEEMEVVDNGLDNITKMDSYQLFSQLLSPHIENFVRKQKLIKQYTEF